MLRHVFLLLKALDEKKKDNPTSANKNNVSNPYAEPAPPASTPPNSFSWRPPS